MNLQPLRGFRDFYPEEMRIADTVLSTWKRVAESYGYEEYEGPVVESAQLWKIKSGNEIPEQMYAFKDKNGEDIALRPEMTPTLARMVAARQKEFKKPIRWFSMPRCFRYEAPQKGRSREFFQLNLDLLGATTMAADAEVIATAIDIMLSFGCTENDFYIRLGNRKVIDAILASFNVKKRQEVCRLIDKIDKMDAKVFKEELAKLVEDADTLYSLITAKDWKKSLEGIKGTELGIQEIEEVMRFIEAYGFKEYVTVDLTIMRGFDYYTSTVFEIFDRSKKYRALGGGGRYDNLVTDFGGEACPGVGYGMGGVSSSLELFLKERKLLADRGREVEYLILPINGDVLDAACSICRILRRANRVLLDVNVRGLRKGLAMAESMGAKKVVIVGPKDLEEGRNHHS